MYKIFKWSDSRKPQNIKATNRHRQWGTVYICPCPHLHLKKDEVCGAALSYPRGYGRKWNACYQVLRSTSHPRNNIKKNRRGVNKLAFQVNIKKKLRQISILLYALIYFPVLSCLNLIQCNTNIYLKDLFEFRNMGIKEAVSYQLSGKVFHTRRQILDFKQGNF